MSEIINQINKIDSGGGTESIIPVIPVILDFSTFTQGSPSNTATANTTKRTFTKGTYVKGLSDNNYYVPSRIKSFSSTKGSFSFVGSGGYGVFFVLPSEYTQKGKIYSIKAKCMSANQEKDKGSFNLMFYKADGTYLNTTSVVDRSASDATQDFYESIYEIDTNSTVEYVLFGSYGSLAESAAVEKTLYSRIIV